jgi:hypothetical protein
MDITGMGFSRWDVIELAWDMIHWSGFVLAAHNVKILIFLSEN